MVHAIRKTCKQTSYQINVAKTETALRNVCLNTLASERHLQIVVTSPYQCAVFLHRVFNVSYVFVLLYLKCHKKLDNRVPKL